MSVFLSFSLFFLSFIPLWISVLFIDIRSMLDGNVNIRTEQITVAGILIGLLISAIIVFSCFRRKNQESTQEYTIVSVGEEKTITAEFLLSYILPLFAFEFTHWDGVVLFLIFFFTLGFLCVKHNHFSVNFLLEVIGYGFYACDVINEDNVETTLAVISRRKLKIYKGQLIQVKSLNNEYKLDVG